MIRRLASFAAAAMLALVPGSAVAQLKVVTSTTDLADIARAVGGSMVAVSYISEGYQDPHFVEAKPSFVLQLRKADVFAIVGLDLEVGWVSLLIDGSRNQRIRPGAAGYMDMSRSIKVLDVPPGNVDRSMGDVHPLGNPHYWLHPENARRLAHAFQEKFSELDRANAESYERNERAFGSRLTAAEKSWAPLLAQIKGKPVIAYHTSWSYLAAYTGMRIVAFMEPKPGVPPAPAHVFNVIKAARAAGARVVIQEPFYERKMSDLVAAQIGGKVQILPPSDGGVRKFNDYIALMQYDIEQLANALR